LNSFEGAAAEEPSGSDRRPHLPRLPKPAAVVDRGDGLFDAATFLATESLSRLPWATQM